jgi:hypothetical protein
MDDQRPVDNCPSIKLKIETAGKSGMMNLSSVWESYNYVSTIDLPAKEIINLYCPYCNSELRGKSVCELCEVCDAPMVPLKLELGGDVCICSRVGCKSHFVKFVDFSFALKKLYLEAGHQGRPYLEEMCRVPKKKEPRTEEEEHIEIMHTGTFLQTYCPHCKKSLIEDESIKLKVDRGEEEGYLMLSPYLNVFTSRSTIRLPEDEVMENIRCFHCNKPLVNSGEKCEACGSKVAHLVVGAASRLVDFYVCSRKGCTWHGLSREDMNDIRLEHSLEW